MRNTHKWYEKKFLEYTGPAKLIQSKKNKDVYIFIRPYYEIDEKEKDLFLNIQKNINIILEKMNSDNNFAIQMKKLAERIIDIYEKKGILPDFLNDFTVGYSNQKNPANMYLLKNGKIQFIDTQTLFYDLRKNKNSENEKKERMNLNIINIGEYEHDDLRVDFIDKLINALNRIKDFQNS